MIEQSYSVGLVILSVVVATIGAYVAVEIAQRVRTAERRRGIFWTCGGALAMGLGIWSMHFVGMLATSPARSRLVRRPSHVRLGRRGGSRVRDRFHHLQSRHGQRVASGCRQCLHGCRDRRHALYGHGGNANGRPYRLRSAPRRGIRRRRDRRSLSRPSLSPGICSSPARNQERRSRKRERRCSWARRSPGCTTRGWPLPSSPPGPPAGDRLVTSFSGRTSLD